VHVLFKMVSTLAPLCSYTRVLIVNIADVKSNSHADGKKAIALAVVGAEVGAEVGSEVGAEVGARVHEQFPSGALVKEVIAPGSVASSVSIVSINPAVNATDTGSISYSF